ncbi:MAG: macro domain-containing protein [Spirochaetales bacterium]
MITFTKGNLLEADVDALVNTVNTVGVMGKGIALMFKDHFKENFDLYTKACKAGQVRVGHMFVTRTNELQPKWIVNFPTKQDWRNPSKIEWIHAGLADLRHWMSETKVKSIALPPLGSGNGGLDWDVVRLLVEDTLADVDAEVLVYEPTVAYQNIRKREGIQKLTTARALISELVRRYWVAGTDCSVLEIQKLAWFLDRSIKKVGLPDQLKLEFLPNRFGPYSDQLRHLLDKLDGSYLHCEKRLSDAQPSDSIWFEDRKKEELAVFLRAEGSEYLHALDQATAMIDGFESPFGMELLATVDWLLLHGVKPEIGALRRGMKAWPVGEDAAERKYRLFDDRVVGIALERLKAIAN